MGQETEKKDVQTESPQRIVLMDDEADILEIFSDELKDAGYEVFCSESVSVAAAMVQKYRPDVLITDLKLPFGGGEDLFQEVLGLPYEFRPKVIFVTGNPHFPAEAAFSQGAEGYLSKPLPNEKLLEEVHRVLSPVPDRWLKPSSHENGLPTVKEKFASVSEAWDSKRLVFGRGGFFFKQVQPKWDAGQKLQFDFEFQSEHPQAGDMRVQGVGVVRWVRTEEGILPSGLGVEILSTDEQSLEILRKRFHITKQLSFIPKG